jgi:hypothetical protein
MRLALTEKFCLAAKPAAGRLQSDFFDSVVSGLALRVSTGSKSWSLTTGTTAKRVRRTLGRFPEVGLARARALALECRADGNAAAMTVGDLVPRFLASKERRSADEVKRRFDVNVIPIIGGVRLSEFHTQATWQSRLLGESRNVFVETNALFLASGNDLMFKGDMTTRALLCRMDAGVERPETRRFDVDLKVEVPKQRTKLVAAGHTILRAFVVAGRPGLDTLEPFGRFEEWSNLVRGALVWLGEPDPCRTRAFIAVDDPERTDLETLLRAIQDNHDDWFTAGELMELAAEGSDDMLMDAINGAVTKASTKLLGQYLKAKAGRIVGGLMLRGAYNKNQKIWRYRVVEV